MPFTIQITGDVADDDTAAHKAIQALAQDVANKLAAIDGITIDTTKAETPSGTTTPIPHPDANA